MQDMTVVTEATLFEKLGGRQAIQAVVEEFYKRVLADSDLNGFFADVNMERQKQQLARFLTAALDGPNEYDGRPMKEAHQGLGITDHHFDLVAGHLVGTLQWAGVSQVMIDEVVALVGPLKKQIVSV